MDDEIKQDPRNARKHGERNKQTIRDSLDNFGAGRSVLADSDGVLIAGNGVFEQAEELGIKHRVIESDGKELIVIKRTDLQTDDEKRVALALADNRTGELAVWDFEALPDIMGELSNELLDLLDMDFAQLDKTIPDDNKDIDESEMERTDNECPSCGFKW